jgi:hypothetical protein
MAIQECNYENEAELQSWMESNLHSFIPHSAFLGGFQITTTSGKGGVPDGFAFDFLGRSWYVLEAELLQHQVWPHIAEQITRFVVALKNPHTTRKIRDRLFEHVVSSGITDKVTRELGTSADRLHQQIELFVEGVVPIIVIIIDKSNRDLEDMARALDAPTKIFRVQKFIVNGHSEYYLPDQASPVISTAPTGDLAIVESDYDVVKLLGGGELAASVGRLKCYRLADGSVVYIRRSRAYPPDNHCWYGLTPSILESCSEHGVSHIVFILGEEGFVKVPTRIVQEFLEHTKVTRNEDGTTRHYHVQISAPPAPVLYWSQAEPQFALADYFVPFD